MLSNLDSHGHACDRKWHRVMSLLSQGCKYGSSLSPQYVYVIFMEKTMKPSMCFKTYYIPFCDPIEPLLRPLGSILGPRSHLDASWGHVGGHMSHLGTSWGHLGRPWGAPGVSLRLSWHLLSHLEASGSIWRPPGEDLGTILEPLGCHFAYCGSIFAWCWFHFGIKFEIQSHVWRHITFTQVNIFFECFIQYTYTMST